MTTVRYSERPNNTPEQVREYVAEALAIVDELDVPDDLREAAFTAAVNLSASKQVLAEQAGFAGLDLGQLRGA